MSPGTAAFQPAESLLSGFVSRACRVCVTIPARNEADSLARCLQVFAEQEERDGSPLAEGCFEVLLLLNNCSDGSADVARQWSREHPEVALHILELALTPQEAHVGTARRLLMDTAWSRLARQTDGVILTTDADTRVARDWIAQTLQAVSQGADVVGGLVRVLPEDLEALPEQVRRCYEQDRLYAEAIARLEALLDPCEGDPWPRHLDHFGSSLGCTTQAYAAAGGMPAVTPLEDEAFIDRVRRAELRLRHEPQVTVWTSARLQGRATIGLAGQFRLWSGLQGPGSHRVPSAASLEHRFRMLRTLRRVYETKDASELCLPTEWWQNTFRQALAVEPSCAAFLGAVYCDTLIAESFNGAKEEPIAEALATLHRRIVALEGKRGPEDGAQGTPQRSEERASVLQ